MAAFLCFPLQTSSKELDFIVASFGHYLGPGLYPSLLAAYSFCKPKRKHKMKVSKIKEDNKRSEAEKKVASRTPVNNKRISFMLRRHFVGSILSRML